MNIAVITGASSGIGKEFALQLDKKYNYDEMWLIARRTDKLNELAKELKNKARVISMDLTNDTAFEEYKNLLETEKPTISLLLNASGYGKFGNISDVSLDEQMGMIDLNVKSLVKMTHISKDFMQRGSKIIQIGSASTYNPLPHFAIYSSTKVFVKYYSRAIARELKPLGITVTCVCPGWVKTDFFDRANISTNPQNTLAKPAVEAKDVVKKAIKDSEKGRDVSYYGLYNNFHHTLAKFMPASFMMSVWMGMVKKVNYKK